MAQGGRCIHQRWQGSYRGVLTCMLLLLLRRMLLLLRR